MSPSLASTREEFPRLTGASNFDIWKTRVTIALDGKNLLGFVTTKDYKGESESESDVHPDSDEDIASPPVAVSAPPTTPDSDAVDYGTSDDELNPSAKSDTVSADSAIDADMATKLPSIKSFSETKRENMSLRAKKKPHRPALSSRMLRQMEAKAKAFLIKTIDDTHVRLIVDAKTAYDIFQTLCAKYEGAAVHGDPYFIQHYLMEIKYEEGSDLTLFFLQLEKAMRAASESMNTTMTDAQMSLYLFHSMPTSWKDDLKIWKGSRTFIPYVELKHNIEAKVRDNLAKSRYTLQKGTPESVETMNETVLKAHAPDNVASRQPFDSSSQSGCNYCNRRGHLTRHCRNLQKDLREGCVKPGTILPDGFTLQETKRKPSNFRQQPYAAKGHPKYSRPVGRGRDRRRGQREGRRNDFSEDRHERSRSEHVRVAISKSTDYVSLSAVANNDMDNVWTVDSGCTRHVVHQKEWFTSLSPSQGKITVGGKNEIPILGSGQIEFVVKDSKNEKRILTLKNVLYAPDIKFNLLSVSKAVLDGIHLRFDGKKCAIMTEQRFKFNAQLERETGLYQFIAQPVEKNIHAHVATNMNGKSNSVMLFHKRLGHPNFTLVQGLSATKAISNVQIKSRDLGLEYICEPCIRAKSHLLPFNKNNIVARAKYPLQKVHSDMNGPLPVATFTGNRYFLIFIDDYSRYQHTFVIKRRSELYGCYEEFRKRARNQLRFVRHRETEVLYYQANEYDTDIQALQADNAREYEKLGRILYHKYGTHTQFTNAYRPSQNGVAERRMRTILERVRAMLFDAKMPKVMWGECVVHAADLINMTPSTVTDNVTPNEKWFKKIPSAEYLKVFGCAAYAHIPEHLRDKLEPRARKCVYLGLPGHKKGYRLLDPNTGHIVYSRDVTFNESEFPKLTFIDTMQRPTPATDSAGSRAYTLTLNDPLSLNAANRHTNYAHAASCDHQSDQQQSYPCKKLKRTTTRDEIYPLESIQDGKNILLSDHDDLRDLHQHQSLVHTLLAARHVAEPRTFTEATSSPYAKQWLAAAHDEYQSLIQNETWTLVEKPSNRKVLSNRWVWAVKHDDKGQISRFKARLVIKGFLQQHGIDYNEIFSPVVRMEVLRLLLTISALMDFEVHQMDVKTAFLNGYLDEEIYMAQPEGFVEKGKENMVCRLRKSLYGLKQAPRVWYNTLCKFLESLSFRRLIKDRCVFIGTIDGHICYIAVYVDDLLIIAPSMRLVDHIKSELKQKFKMTDLGEAKYLLGWSIVRNRKDRTMLLHQESYASKVLEKYKHLVNYAVATPYEPNAKLSAEMAADTLEDIAFMKKVPYREIVGCFMYLVVGTRPDLAYFIREVSQFVHNPGVAHWNAVIRGLKYLYGTKSHGIQLGGMKNMHLLKDRNYLSAYTDSDYANCPDTRRSVGGYISFFCNSPISWASKKHHTVVLSTTEAEYIALCHCMQEIIFLKLLLKELTFESQHPITIYEDNQSCIKVSNNPELHGRSKHIDIRYHFVQEKVEKKEFVIKYCPTQQMIADIFTKALRKHQFAELKTQLKLKTLEQFCKAMK